MDVDNHNETNIDDAIEAFMKADPVYVEEVEGLVDEDEEKIVQEDEADDSADESDDTDAEASEDDDVESEETPAKAADDEDEVTVPVNGKDMKVKVKDLKRLFGQEASLTQKSQALSEATRATEAQGIYLAKILDARLAQANAKVAKYAGVDLFKASRELEPADFDAIRGAQADAASELKLLQEEAAQFVSNAQNTRMEVLRGRAKAALVEISKSIPEWNDELYGKIRTYAVSQGLDRDSVNEIVDPGAILMMHKAMKFDAASAKTDSVTKKVIKSSKKVIKKSDNPSDFVASRLKQVSAAAAKSGDVDDLADLYLARQKNS